LSSGADEAFLVEIRRIARECAAPHADEVDGDARFPREAVDALRDVQALSALVPVELGGGGVSFEGVAQACQELARGCAATGMVFAMHQIQVAIMVRHGGNGTWFPSYLTELAAGQRLVASVTSEVGTGGDMGRSIAAVTTSGSGSSFEKQATTVSYGEHADDLFTTVRRSPDAEPGDQVIVLTRDDQTSMERQSEWQPLGMRGTCSPGFIVRAGFDPEQILPVPFSRVSAESMVPISHLLWSQVWLGIASDAFDRSRAYVRSSARQRPGELPPSAPRLSAVLSDLTLLRAEVASTLRYFSDASMDDLGTIAAAVRFNNLKIAASEQAARICLAALQVSGIAGYRNDTPYSVGRHIRDSLSAALMIGNDRIHETNARLLLLAKDV
jgi:acyl-CoA dehydrogenase